MSFRSCITTEGAAECRATLHRFFPIQTSVSCPVRFLQFRLLRTLGIKDRVPSLSDAPEPLPLPLAFGFRLPSELLISFLPLSGEFAPRSLRFLKSVDLLEPPPISSCGRFPSLDKVFFFLRRFRRFRSPPPGT